MGIRIRKLKNYCKNHGGIVALIAIGVVIVLIATIFTVTFLTIPGEVSAVSIKQMPSKLTYIEGELFDTNGLVIEAKYKNGQRLVVDDWTYDLHDKLKPSDTLVNVSYGGLKLSIPIVVTQRQIVELSIRQMPNKLSYIEGELFDANGLIVEAKYDNGTTNVVEDWTCDKSEALNLEDILVKISFGGLSLDIEITVAKKQLESIEMTSSPIKLKYYEGEYFDFLGLEIIARYGNSDEEKVNDFVWDITRALKASDTNIVISYTSNEVTKSINIPIVVEIKSDIVIEQERIDNVIDLLPKIEELNKDNIDAIDYAIKLLEEANNLTDEQERFKVELEKKRQEIIENLPPEVEKEYAITYLVANDLSFSDMDFGDNPTLYKNSNGTIGLNDPSSNLSIELGYYFLSWQLDNRDITEINNLKSDVTIYAVFSLTETMEVKFVDYYDNDNIIYQLDSVKRTTEFSIFDNSIDSKIYASLGKLAVSYYDTNKQQVTKIDLSLGASRTILVLTKAVRELHLANEESVSVSWKLDFADEFGNQTISAKPQVGTVFVVPIGAQVTMTALHANISDILLDGASKGEYMTSTLVHAVFELLEGSFPVSVTFETVLKDVTTISFIGNNHKEVVYPKGWNGIIAKIDLEGIAFVYNEEDRSYLNTYIIDNNKYYFEDLASYQFTGNTSVWVEQRYNSFNFKIVYANGRESFDGLIGRQTLSDALKSIDKSNLIMLETLLSGTIYSDEGCNHQVTVDEIMDTILLEDLTFYSKYSKPLPPPPEEPTFEPVDYSSSTFFGEWRSTFTKNGNILSSEIFLSEDGYYTYKTFVNGTLNADIYGQYRLENNVIVLKTFKYNYEYEILTPEDLHLNIAFTQDNIMSATFIWLNNKEISKFDQFLTKGAIKPINYSGKDYLKSYENNGIVITLKANGIAEIDNGSVRDTVFYRVIDGEYWIFSNGDFGTGNITDFIGGNA